MLKFAFINLKVYSPHFFQFFYDGGAFHRETRPLICRANQSTGFYTIGASVLKELIKLHSSAATS